MTNKLVQREITKIMADYKPVYVPFLPLFLNGAIYYDALVGKVNFEGMEAVGDLRAKVVTPKDTEQHQFGATLGKKAFKKYFFGGQFKQSTMQDTEGYERIIGQILDENNKYCDEIFFTGDGTADNNVVNNGLYFSADPNHVTNSSAEIAAGSDAGLKNLYANIAAALEEMKNQDGSKLVLTWGSTMSTKLNGLMASDVALSKVLSDAFGEVSFAKIPTAMPTSGNGYLIVNLDQVQAHLTILPKVEGQGINEENRYAWTNILFGSSMLDVKMPGAVTKQPLTFA